MSEKVEPALSAEEWAAYRRWSDAESALDVPPLHLVIEDFSAAGAIAAYNDMLPDSDPRKITREAIAILREAADAMPDVREEASAVGEVESYLAPSLRRIADALQSYLPPPV